MCSMATPLILRDKVHVPARTGKGFVVAKGDLIRIADLEGHQPVDFWALNRVDIYEHLSCEHTKPSIEKLFPHTGDAASLRSQLRSTSLAKQSTGTSARA